MFPFPLFSMFIFIYSSCCFKPIVCWYFTAVTDSTFESFIYNTTYVTTQDILVTSEVSSTNINVPTMVPTTLVEFSSVTTSVLPSFMGNSSRQDILTTSIDFLLSQENSKTSDPSSLLESIYFSLSTKNPQTMVPTTLVEFSSVTTSVLPSFMGNSSRQDILTASIDFLLSQENSKTSDPSSLLESIYFSLSTKNPQTMVPTTLVEFSSVTTSVLPSFMGNSSRQDILTTSIDFHLSQENSKTSDLSSPLESIDFSLSTKNPQTMVPTTLVEFSSVTLSVLPSFMGNSSRQDILTTSIDFLLSQENSKTSDLSSPLESIDFSLSTKNHQTMVPTTLVEFSSVTLSVLPSFIGNSSRQDILTTSIDFLISQENSKTSDLSSPLESIDFSLSTKNPETELFSTFIDFPLSTQNPETELSSTDIVFPVSSVIYATTESSLVNPDIMSSTGIPETTKASSTEDTQQKRISVEVFAGSLCAVVIVMVVAFIMFYQLRHKSIFKNFRDNSKHSSTNLYENGTELDHSNYQDLTPVRNDDDQTYAVTLNTNTYYNMNL